MRVIQRLENNKIAWPRNLAEIATALDVSQEWLMCGVSEVRDLDEEGVQIARALDLLSDSERAQVRKRLSKFSEKK
ncbi:MAG: hypothetical protein ACI9VM_000605 [Candidatus Azotimanducaceae bacterium]|jgi:hypothetical protein